MDCTTALTPPQPIKRKGSIMADSLFERLGGTEGITVIAKDIVQRHLDNPDIGTRFSEGSGVDLKQLGKFVVEFLTAGSGGPGDYTGRDMASAHAHMNINEREFISVMNDISKALKAYGVSDETHDELIGISYSLKDEVMFK